MSDSEKHKPVAWGLTQAYDRYGGLMQCSPLTEDEQRYDDTCRAIDELQAEVGKRRLSLFTAGEFIWFNGFVGKTHVFPKQEQLDHQLADLNDLLAALDSRA